MKVYGLICDSGDGSAYIAWYTNLNRVNELLEEEEYYQNENHPKATLTLPDDADLQAIGIRISE